jgi:Putative adhesin
MSRTLLGTKSVRPILQPLLVILVPAALVWAAGEGRIEKTFDTTREPRISLNNIEGNVLVRGWDKAQVHVVYSLSSPRMEVDSDVRPDRIHFDTHVLDPSLPPTQQVADYTLDVPAGATLEVRNPQGKIIVDGMQADATLQSVSADITVRDYSGHLSVRSVTGDIEIIRPSGDVEAESITGNLHFVSPTTNRLHGTTTSGRILYEGNFAGHGEYILSAYSGDVDIVCPVSASYELTAKTLKGKVINSMPMTHRREPASSQDARRSLLGTYNTGRATLELTSFSGNIRIRPQN